QAPGHEDSQFIEVAEVAPPGLPRDPPPRPHLRHQQDEPPLQGAAGLRKPPFRGVFAAVDRQPRLTSPLLLTTLRSRVMVRISNRALVLCAVAIVAAAGFATMAAAQNSQTEKTPQGWS